MKINLDIDSLILHGFNPADRARIGAVVQRELTRLLAERGAPPSLAEGKALTRIDGGQFQMRPGARPETIGTHIAQQIFQGLSSREN